MTRSLTATLLGLAILLPAGALADDVPADAPEVPMAADDSQPGDAPTDDAPTDDAKPDTPDADDPDAGDIGAAARKSVGGIRESIDENATAQRVSAGLLQFVYDAAENLSFPAFHWVAFAVMVTGVVSFALQLVLGKLVVLTKGGFSLTAILSDALGLVVSAVGLVLTTQAAAENSTFTQSAAAVLSAAGIGAVAGFLFYLWGQRQELEAVRGRSKPAAKTKK